MGLRLAIIIVNWNGKDVLRDCLESVRRYRPELPFEIIVVDNSSSDGSVGFLKSEIEEWDGVLSVIFNNENVGFGRANNQAMAISNAEYFFLLNSDAEIVGDAACELVRVADSDPKIGAVGPRLLNPDRSLQISVWRNPPVFWEILLSGLRLYKLIPQPYRGEILLGEYWAHDKMRAVKMLSGAAFLIKKEMFREIGGFDEDMHMYGEDCEYSLRIYRSGWKLIFTPDAKIIHKGGQSSHVRWKSAEKLKVQTRGILQFQEKSLPRIHVLANCLAMLLVLRLERIWRRLRNRSTVDVDAGFEVYKKFLSRGSND